MTETERLPFGKLWNVSDVADYLGVSTSWVYLHVRLADLPYLRVGGLLRFQPDAARAFAHGERVTVGAVLSLRKSPSP